MGNSWLRTLRDAGDVLRRAKNPKELAKALMPNAWLARVVLNDSCPESDTPSRAVDAAKALRQLGQALTLEAIGEDGSVDYAGLKLSGTFSDLDRTSRSLHLIDPAQLGDDQERIAFWMNLYNVLAIHGVISMGIEETVMERPSFFGVVAYRVGDYVVTLDEIENGILRRNAPHPVTKSPPFDDDDPRLVLCPSHVDARIHAALVCAARSCPPVAFYDAARLDAQLDAAADNYVAANLEVDEEAKRIRIPITFRYYEPDFGRHAGVAVFLLHHATKEQRPALERALSANYAFAYQRYDWSLNSKSTRSKK